MPRNPWDCVSRRPPDARAQPGRKEGAPRRAEGPPVPPPVPPELPRATWPAAGEVRAALARLLRLELPVLADVVQLRGLLAGGPAGHRESARGSRTPGAPRHSEDCPVFSSMGMGGGHTDPLPHVLTVLHGRALQAPDRPSPAARGPGTTL